MLLLEHFAFIYAMEKLNLNYLMIENNVYHEAVYIDRKKSD